VQGYNAPTGGDGGIRSSSRCALTNEANDQAQCLPMLEKAEQAVAGLCAEGHPRTIKAAALDAGYNRNANLEPALEKPYPVYIAMEKDRKQRKRKDRVAPLGRPEGPDAWAADERSLDTKVGQQTYAPARSDRGARERTDQGRWRRPDAAARPRQGSQRFTAACIAHNLKKLWRHDRPMTTTAPHDQPHRPSPTQVRTKPGACHDGPFEPSPVHNGVG